MIEQSSSEEILYIIREIETDPHATQRTLSAKLGISLGKTNYLLNELIKKGLISARNFSTSPGKLRKINYLLTKRGFEERVTIATHFLERKTFEYNRLKQECRRITLRKGSPAEGNRR